MSRIQQWVPFFLQSLVGMMQLGIKPTTFQSGHSTTRPLRSTNCQGRQYFKTGDLGFFLLMPNLSQHSKYYSKQIVALIFIRFLGFLLKKKHTFDLCCTHHELAMPHLALCCKNDASLQVKSSIYG